MSTNLVPQLVAFIAPHATEGIPPLWTGRTLSENQTTSCKPQTAVRKCARLAPSEMMQREANRRPRPPVERLSTAAPPLRPPVERLSTAAPPPPGGEAEHRGSTTSTPPGGEAEHRGSTTTPPGGEAEHRGSTSTPPGGEAEHNGSTA
ncbi:unnamed protein product [Gadus morhua 'NCC']